MANADIRCVLLKVHGVGNQKRTWSRGFDKLLDKRLKALTQAERGRFKNESFFWADLSRGPGLSATASVAATMPTGSSDLQYMLVRDQFSQYLAPESGSAATAAFGINVPNPRKVIANLKDTVVRAVDSANDVANYVSNNGVRLQIQERLSTRLTGLQKKYPNAAIILGTHSQGTIISYDVLRLNGRQLPAVTTWVTMGSPLAWYLNFLRWGSEQIGLPENMRWLNYFDKKDRVGKAVKGVVDWDAPKPTDVNVNNTGNGVDPHDHWHNPKVADRYFNLIKKTIA